ncbi:hypothetical protein STEG23_009900 [Scotinomys teguina]
MKILILAATALNFVIYFPYNGSQEIHSQREQHFSANPPLSNHTARNSSSTLEAEENSPIEESSSYSSLLDRIEKITGSPSEGNHLEMLQADLESFPPSGNDELHSLLTNWTSIGFAYATETADSPTEADYPKSNASPYSDAIQDKSAVSSFPPNYQITQRRRRMPLSRESRMPPPKSMIHDQYNFELSNIPDLDRDLEISQSHQHFPSIGRNEELFASDPTTYMKNSMEKFTTLVDEGTVDIANENIFLGNGITTNEKAEQESVFFIDSTAPIKRDVVIPKKYFGRFTDKDMPNEEESTFYTEVESKSELDVFQETEDIPSNRNLKHFELEDGGFERDGFINSNTKNSLSQFIIIPSTEITVSDGDLIIPEKENADALFVTNPTNRKIYLKPMATKTKINNLDVSTSIKQNAETGGSVAVSTPSNSMHKIERTGYSRPLNIYYDVISKPIIAAIKDQYVTWKTIKNEQLSSTIDSGNIINLRNDYQTPTDITTKKSEKLADKRETATNEVRNRIHGITGVLNSNFNKDKGQVRIDLDSAIADSPIRKYIIKINDFKTLKRKPNDLGSASSDDHQVFRDEESVLSNVLFKVPQVANPVNELSWATIMAHEIYTPNKSTITASKVGITTATNDTENPLYMPGYDSETSFEEDTILNYEANLQNKKSIKSEEEHTIEEENIKDHIYVVPMEDDYSLKKDRLATTHYKIYPDVYDNESFRDTIEPRAGQPGFENPENAISKPLLSILNPEVQRKIIATNRNSDSNHDGLFSDTTHRLIQENVPSIYTFTQETVPKFIGRDSSITMKGNVNPGKAMGNISKTNLMTSFDLINVTKMPQNATIISSYTSALETKEGSRKNGTTVHAVGDIRPIGLRSLLIPKQKISRTEVPLGDNDMTETVVMSEVSEPTEEHLNSIDQNWEVIEDASAESHMQLQVGENKANNMDLTTIDLSESSLEFLSNENVLYSGEEENSLTIRKPTTIQGVLYRKTGNPVSLPSTHVTENPSEENSVQSKYDQKFKVWFLRRTNSDSDNNGAFVQDLPAPFYNKPPKFMATHFPTNKNGKFSPKFSEGFTPKGSSISRSEGGDSENIHTSHSKPVTGMGERRGFPSKIAGPTIEPTTVTGRKQLPRKGLSSTAFNVLWEAKATMSPKSEYNKTTASRSESYNSEDTTVLSPPVIISPDSGFPLVYDHSEPKILKESSSSSHVKKTNTANAITSLSFEKNNDWSGDMPPDENAITSLLFEKNNDWSGDMPPDENAITSLSFEKNNDWSGDMLPDENAITSLSFENNDWSGDMPPDENAITSLSFEKNNDWSGDMPPDENTITSLSFEKNNDWSGDMPPDENAITSLSFEKNNDENARSGESSLPPTTELRKIYTKDWSTNYVLFGDRTFIDSSKLESIPTISNEYIDILDETDNRGSQVIRPQTYMYPLHFNSSFPHKTSAIVIRKSINDNTDLSSPMEMSHTQDSHIPLTEFGVIFNDEFFFADDSDDLSNMASPSLLPINAMQTTEVNILDSDSSYKGESVVPVDDSNEFKGSLALQSSAKHRIIPDTSSEYHETSDSLKSDFLTNSPAAWSDTFETMTDYIDIINNEETLVITNSSVPFNLPQATDTLKELFWVPIVAHKTYPPSKSTTTASNVSMTAASHDAGNLLNSPRDESETSFEEDTTLNYEANLQNEESIRSEKKDILEEESIKDYIFIVPMVDDSIHKKNGLDTTHYSNKIHTYDTTFFRRAIKPRAGHPGFENPGNVVSKPLLARFNPEVERKMIATSSNSDSNHDGLLSDTTHRMIQENVPRIYTFIQETVPKFIGRDSSITMKGNVKPGKAMEGISKTNLMTSFDLVNVTKMPQNATIISPYTFALENEEGNSNSGTTVHTVGDIQPIGLKSLLIPKQKISRTEVPLGDNDMLSNTAVMSEVSEPTEEHLNSIDQNWEVIDEPSADKPFSHISPVPLEDPMPFPEKTINIADIHTPENGDISDDTDNTDLSPKTGPQTATHKKTGINKDTEFISHHVQQTADSSAAQERATSGNEANTFFSDDKTVVEEKFYISGDNIPENLEEINTMQATPLLPKPVIASTQQKGLENSRQIFYPSSTMSTSRMTQVQATELLPFGNWDGPSTNSYNKFYHLPTKMAFYSTDFIKNSNSKLDPALIIGETTTKMTDDFFIPDDLLALSDNEVISPDDAPLRQDLNNVLDGEERATYIEKGDMTSYGVIYFTEDSSAESHMQLQVGENEANNMDLTTIDLGESSLEFLSNENVLYSGEEENSLTIRKPTTVQEVLYRETESPASIPSTHVTENPSEENSLESKYDQKFKVWFLRRTNSDSDNNGAFVQDLPTLLYNKSSKFMATHFPTNKNDKFSPNFSEGFTPKGSSISRSEGGDSENISTSHSESVTGMGERSAFPTKITGPTIESTTVTGRKQLPRKGLSSTAFNVLWEAKATMSPKSKYNKTMASRSESYNSEDITVLSPPVIISPDSGFSLVYDHSKPKILKESSSSSHVKKTNTANAITSLSFEKKNDWSGAMPPDENDSLPPTTESMNTHPEELTMDSAPMIDKPLADILMLELVPTGIKEYIDLLDETDNQGIQVFRPQTGLYPPTLNSSFPHKPSANVIRKSINSDADTSSTIVRENIMAEMPHSQDSHIPLAEFRVITNNKFSSTDDSEDSSNMASLPLSPINAMQTAEITILDSDSSYEGESVVPGDDNNRFKAS